MKLKTSDKITSHLEKKPPLQLPAPKTLSCPTIIVNTGMTPQEPYRITRRKRNKGKGRKERTAGKTTLPALEHSSMLILI
jgi:hypothetical protein